MPPAVAGDPFLNRDMRLGLGIQPGERRIGQAAHDVVMLGGTQDLVLTRARRVGTSPGLPSRFLLRLAAFVGPERWTNTAVARGEACLAALASAGGSRPAAAHPAAATHPGRATHSRTHQHHRGGDADGRAYALYARRILRLEPLEPIDPPPDARDRGTILHRVLERYTKEAPPADPAAAETRLRDLATAELRALASEPELQLFWQRAFEAMLPGFLAYDAEARRRTNTIIAEARATMPLDLPSRSKISLVGKADRIEIGANGQARIVDYKTGTPPKWPTIVEGKSPQLTLTARLAEEGAFKDLPPMLDVESIAYLPIGGRQPVVPVHAEKTRAEFGPLARDILPKLVAKLDALARVPRPMTRRSAQSARGVRRAITTISRALPNGRSLPRMRGRMRHEGKGADLCRAHSASSPGHPAA